MTMNGLWGRKRLAENKDYSNRSPANAVVHAVIVGVNGDGGAHPPHRPIGPNPRQFAGESRAERESSHGFQRDRRKAKALRRALLAAPMADEKQAACGAF